MATIPKKNGTFPLNGVSYGSFTRVHNQQMQCPVCCQGLGHDCDLELHQTPVGRLWICNCWHEIDCCFAVSGGLTKDEIRKLAEERISYLNTLGFGINHRGEK